MPEHRLAWSALSASQQRSILSALQNIAGVQGAADKGSDHFSKEPRVEICAVAANAHRVTLDDLVPAHLTVHYIFDHMIWCMAQSGSDWYWHYVFEGTAVFTAETRRAPTSLTSNAFERRRDLYVHEYDSSTYDPTVARREVRQGIEASLDQ